MTERPHPTEIFGERLRRQSQIPRLIRRLVEDRGDPGSYIDGDYNLIHFNYYRLSPGVTARVERKFGLGHRGRDVEIVTIYDMKKTLFKTESFGHPSDIDNTSYLISVHHKGRWERSIRELLKPKRKPARRKPARV